MSELGEQIAKALKHPKVLIIDDAYDAMPGLEDIGLDAIASCREVLIDEKVFAGFQAVARRTFEVERLSEILEDEDTRGLLWSARDVDGDAKAALAALFAAAPGAIQAKKSSILPLESLIRESLKLELVTMGSKAIDEGGEVSKHLESRLLFIDYYLDADSRGEAAVDASLKKIAAIYGKYAPGDKPIVVLMSSEKLTIPQQQRFRRTLSVLGSHFSFIHKPELANQIDVQIRLDSLRKTYANACAIDKAIATWEAGARESIATCAADLKALDIADYAFLDKFRLDQERAHLGHYVLWLFSEYLNALIERRPEINAIADELDKMSVDPLFPPTLMPDEALTKIYSGAVFTDFRPKPPRERPSDDAHKYRVMLGDLYRVHHRDNAKKVDEAFVVITPACNLARAQSGTRVTLLRGVLKPKAESIDSDVVPEFVSIDDRNYAADWEFEAAHVLTVEEIYRKLNNQDWRHVSRLRPIYALYLQRNHALKLLNVGMPVPTQSYYPLSAEVLGRGAEGAATTLFKCEDSDALVWRVTGSKGMDKVVVFLEEFVKRLRVALLSGTAKDKAAADNLEDLIKLRAPLQLDKKLTAVGASFSVQFLAKYEKQDKYTGAQPVLIRVYPGDLAPREEAVPDGEEPPKQASDSAAAPTASAPPSEASPSGAAS